MVCRIFRKAHGRSCSQKRLLWRGITLLSGAQTDLAYREINTLPQSTRFQRLPLTIRFPPAAPRRYSRASFIPPESCRGFPTDDVGQFWRTETGQFWSAPKRNSSDPGESVVEHCVHCPTVSHRNLTQRIASVRLAPERTSIRPEKQARNRQKTEYRRATIGLYPGIRSQNRSIHAKTYS